MKPEPVFVSFRVSLVLPRGAVLSTEGIGIRTRVRPKRRRLSSFLQERPLRRRTSAFVRARFSFLAALIDGTTVTLSALMVGVVYHAIFYKIFGVSAAFVEFSLLTALMFVLFNVLHHEYEISSYLTFPGHARRAFLVWNIAFLTVMAFIFMTKQTVAFSRGSIVIFYGVGLLCVICCRAGLVSKVKTNAVIGKVSAVRVVLVGNEADVQDFTTRYTPWLFGVDIVASFVLRGADTLHDDLALASASARVLKPDDIYILLPWTEAATIEACITAFVKVPASIHLGPQRVLDRYSSVSVSRIGKVYSLNVVRRPLANIDIIIKRAFDLAVGIPLLIGLSPLLLLLALAIKLDSPGPVLFTQRRYGFNQENFRIVKFRSMSVSEDGRGVRQAVRNDPRVTRIGHLMRRCNLDEFPQLVNVIRGDMSLVGPRPHALIHNQQYERTIADYARRHNVKPGITGWAQIHGLRGEITSDSTMRQRVEYDLYYIDNWTIGMDLRILAMTLLSPKAFANAY